MGLSLVALSNQCPPIAKLSGDGGNDMLRVDFGASDGPIGLASHRGIVADGGSGQDTLTAPVDVVSRRVETHQSASSWRAFVNASVQPIIEEMANIGLFVGIVGPNGTRETYSFGAMNEAGKPVTSQTAFEIGSITKTFTASLLADMVARGEVSLDDPVRLYLPADADVPRRGDRELTLLELATHTSGLPRDTHDFDRRFAAVLADIEAGQLSEEHLEALFTAEIARDWPRLRDDLKEITLDEIEHPPHMYSNLGMGLLGFALARHLTLTEFGAREAPIGSGAETASVSYESAIRNRILSPLGLRDIFQAITPSRESSIATGTAYDGETTTPPMLFDTLAGAGALRATGLDMLRYLDAQTGRFPSPLNAAIAATHEPRDQIEADPVPTSIGLGWFTAETPAGTIVGHNGATFGFQSEIRFNATTGAGFVVLMNSTSEAIAPAVATLLDNLQTALLLTDQPNAPAAPPSATVSWESAKGIVLITGTANADTVSVEQRDGADTITVTTHIEMDGGDQLAIDHVFASSAIREIQADLGEGDDQLNIRTRSLSRGTSIRITGRLGAGNDSARLELENPISSRASVVASLFGDLGDDDLQAFSVGNSARTTS
ncbi:MAG: beta-lactamase family protein, partial [Planctomycetales bacterium]|nr:beta-lactamase family protein [Planctomycetales bacterium]